MEAGQIGHLIGIIFRWCVGIYLGYLFSRWSINKFHKRSKN